MAHAAAAEAARAVAQAAQGAAAAARACGDLVASATLVAVGRAALAAASILQPACDEIVKAVDNRLEALAPVLEAQELAARAGRPCHSARGLVPNDVPLRGNAARHLAFGGDFAALTCQALRAIQRGKRRRRGKAHKGDYQMEGLEAMKGHYQVDFQALGG